MKNKLFSKKSFFIYGLFVCFFVGASKQEQHLELFVQALHSIKKHYIHPISTKRLIHGAIKGMLLELDPYSQFLSLKENQKLSHKIKGESYGLGLELEKNKEGFIVMSVLPNSPAKKAGFLPGDQILKIENPKIKKQKLKNMKLKELKQLFQKNKNYHFLVLREKQFLQLQARPKKLKSHTVLLKKLEESIFYLKIYRFSFNTPLEIRKALKNKKLRALILDLRNNPGGVLDSAIQSADLFLSQGLILSYKIKDQEEKFYAKESQNLGDFSMVILLNGFSASGSEVLAGALQYHKRAIIMGQKSFGKGLMQNIFALRDQNALSLTVAEYKTPGGKAIQGQGITPDQILPPYKLLSGEGLDISKDTEVLRALKELKN